MTLLEGQKIKRIEGVPVKAEMEGRDDGQDGADTQRKTGDAVV